MERNFTDGYTEWQSNPEIVAVNKLPQHATLMPYEDFEEAKFQEAVQCFNNQNVPGALARRIETEPGTVPEPALATTTSRSSSLSRS